MPNDNLPLDPGLIRLLASKLLNKAPQGAGAGVMPKQQPIMLGGGGAGMPQQGMSQRTLMPEEVKQGAQNYNMMDTPKYGPTPNMPGKIFESMMNSNAGNDRFDPKALKYQDAVDQQKRNQTIISAMKGAPSGGTLAEKYSFHTNAIKQLETLMKSVQDKSIQQKYFDQIQTHKMLMDQL